MRSKKEMPSAWIVCGSVFSVCLLFVSTVAVYIAASLNSHWLCNYDREVRLE